MARASYKGKYIPKHPEKYMGDVHNIVFRSLWERQFMQYADLEKNIINWSSEEVVIPYVSPVDGKTHRYFVDFKIVYRNKEDQLVTALIEIKPEYQTQEPKIQAKKTRKYVEAVTTWLTNKAKWDAAKLYCDRYGYKFFIFTERHLKIGTKYKRR